MYKITSYGCNTGQDCQHCNFEVSVPKGIFAIVIFGLVVDSNQALPPYHVLDVFIVGKAGQIMAAISERGFQVSAIQMFHIEKANAEEFLEVYKGVVAEYKVTQT